MLKKWLTKILPTATSPTNKRPKPIATPFIIPREDHPISRRHISDGALKVIAKLRSAGFSAYLVGGSVRDLLLGKRPKDFDVATDATPEQIRDQFRNSTIIGRRFRIVHVRFGREVIEVTTFRGDHDDDSSGKAAVKHETGMLLRDNVFGGTIEEDARRRDFTVNAMYYTTEDFAVYDYCHGMADLKAKLIRLIGDPETRYREDPVRMLRAVRFASKLHFTIEQHTGESIHTLGHLLRNIAPARLFDEMLKLFLSGHAVATFRLLQQYQLFQHLFPATSAALIAHPEQVALLEQALANTDERLAAEKTVTPAFLFGALLWPALQHAFNQLQKDGVPDMPALQQAATNVIHRQLQTIAIPRRFSLPMREIWDLQWRLPNRSPRRAENLFNHPRFRAAYDFLLLRQQSGENLKDLCDWWTAYQHANQDNRVVMSHEERETSDAPIRKRRRPRRRKPPAAN
jgi:poly(A) polymerase